jgi:hypothetical protein
MLLLVVLFVLSIIAANFLAYFFLRKWVAVGSLDGIRSVRLRMILYGWLEFAGVSCL